MIKDRIRVFNKKVTNRITRRFAYRPRGSFAIVRHVGRRSGKTYETPILVEPAPGGDGVVIALTYGPKVDWYRNVQAAGGCTLLWHNRIYRLGKPEPLSAQAGRSAFPQPQRTLLRLLGIRDFAAMKFQEEAHKTAAG